MVMRLMNLSISIFRIRFCTFWLTFRSNFCFSKHIYYSSNFVNFKLTIMTHYCCSKQFFFIWSTIILFTVLYNTSFRQYSLQLKPTNPLDPSSLTKSHDEKSYRCVIPKTPILPFYFKSGWKPKFRPNCSHHSKVFKLINDSKLVRTRRFQKTKCCVHEILRSGSDNRNSLGPCEVMGPNMTEVGDKEFFLVNCDSGRHLQGDTTLRIKEQIQEKIDYWAEKTFQNNERPLNVFFIAFDSTSRANMYRNLPKSIVLMKKLGFIDFDSYQSIQPSTLTNFMALLMGMKRSVVRETCSKSWSSYFDECPFIWKNFSDAGYITTYIEDGDASSFNFGGQSGFGKAPTDYYLHHFFRAVSSARKKQFDKLKMEKNKALLKLLNSTKDKPNFRECPSSETVPQFVLRYSERILMKFHTTPTPSFLFTFFAYPFHDSMQSLGSMDDLIYKFFQKLNSTTQIFDNTLIFFWSDHGDRSTFYGKSIIRFIERGNPPLFIRPSNLLVRQYPKIVDILKYNSKILTTPFDIHHTLLHLLDEYRQQSQSKFRDNMNEDFENKFNPVWSNRSSLFVELDKSRNCSQLSVPPGHCLCNIQFDEYSDSSEISLEESLLFKKILNYSVIMMNQIIDKDDYYRQVCERVESIKLSAKYRISNGEIHGIKYVEHIVGFVTYTTLATFDARVRTYLDPHKDNLTDQKMEFLGYSRTNRYNNQSWCVRGETDFDKDMKELCSCVENQVILWRTKENEKQNVI